VNNVAKFAMVIALTVIAPMAQAETLQEKFERAKKVLIDSGTSADHINSISLVAQLTARDKVCPPDDKLSAHTAWETGMQAKETGLSKEAIVSKADALVPLFVEFFNSDPAEKKLACMP
jgi:hypothetical protein